MNTNSNFPTRIAEILSSIDPQLPEAVQDAAYSYILTHANENELTNTAIALPVVYSQLYHADSNPNSRFGIPGTHMAYWAHCLAVCRMLIDLHIPLDHRDEDVLLASALCHVLPENIHIPDLQDTLCRRFHLDPQVYQVVQLIFREYDGTEAEQQLFYSRIQGNKLALLIKLADRGNLVEQLYGVSSWSAKSYMHETKTFFLPMCIQAKQQYPEIAAPVSVMMEKMRCLTEVAEILLNRYAPREAELMSQILELEEENAMLSGMIHSLQAYTNL